MNKPDIQQDSFYACSQPFKAKIYIQFLCIMVHNQHFMPSSFCQNAAASASLGSQGPQPHAEMQKGSRRATHGSICAASCPRGIRQDPLPTGVAQDGLLWAALNFAIITHRDSDFVSRRVFYHNDLGMH
eukprot:COSAG06_NODE_291_length_18216_cov_13.929514_4_plen_129_part_00